MDKYVVKNCLAMSIRINIKSRKTIAIIFFTLILNTIIMVTNKNTSGLNCWNGIFFLMQNRELYILYFLGTYFLLLNKFIINNQFLIIRLKNKKNWLLLNCIFVVIVALFYTLIFFFSSIVSAILILGYSTNWSSLTLKGTDSYTGFYNLLTPAQGILLCFARFLLSAIFLGLLELILRILIKKNNSKIKYLIISSYLLLNMIFNIEYIPILRYVSIGNNYLFFYNNNISFISFLILGNSSLIVLIIIEKYISSKVIRGVEFIK